MRTNATLADLKNRRSIRKYDSKQIGMNELETILDAATYAPTGKGTQAPLIIAVQDQEDLATLRRLNAQVMGVSSDPYYGAPTILLVLVDKVSTTPIHDGSAVITYALVAAHSLGLSTCWINREKEMFESEEGKALLRKWGYDPERYIGVAGASLGYAAVAQPAPALRKKDYYKIIS